MESLLKALVSCYANGITSSEEAEARIHNDRVLRALVGRNLPDATSIRRFRQRNRNNLVAALENALIGGGREKPSETFKGPLPSDQRSLAHAQALEILEEAMLMDTANSDD